MKPVGYWAAKLMCKVRRSQEPMLSFYRRHGVKLGTGCLICSNLLTREPFLVEIGNNVTVSTNVTFCTHDNCIKLLYPGKSDLFGRIVVGDDCFIGENATILYGVTIAPRTIVAAGAVVTKTVTESGTVIGGNPAKKIGTWERFAEKAKDKAIQRSELLARLREDDSFLVVK